MFKANLKEQSDTFLVFHEPIIWLGFPCGSDGKKKFACNVGDLSFWSLGREDPLEKGMAFLPGEFHGQRSLAGKLQSMGSQRFRHSCAANTFTFIIWLDHNLYSPSSFKYFCCLHFYVLNSVMNIFVYKYLSAPLIHSKNYYAKCYELLCQIAF